MRAHKLDIVFFLEVFRNLVNEEGSRLVDRSRTIYNLHTIFYGEGIVSLDDFGLKLLETFDDIF